MRMGYLHHEKVSSFQIAWNRFIFRLVRVITFQRVSLQFRPLPPKAPWSIELGGPEDPQSREEILHNMKLAKLLPDAGMATWEGAVSANRVMRVAEGYTKGLALTLKDTHVPDEPTTEQATAVVDQLPNTISPEVANAVKGGIILNADAGPQQPDRYARIIRERPVPIPRAVD
jgi:hypothetical protein